MSNKSPHSNVVYVFSIIIPLFLVSVIFKLLRISGDGLLIQDQSVTSIIWLLVNLFKSDIVFYALLASLALLFSWQRFVTRGVFLILCLIFFFIEVSSYLFYRETGLILDWSLFQFGIERSQKLSELIENRLQYSQILGIGAICGYLLVVPEILRTRIGNDRKRESGRFLLVGLLLVILNIYFSYQPVLHDKNIELQRNSVMQLLLTWSHAAERVSVNIDEDQRDKFELVSHSSVSSRNVVIVILESTRERSVDPYVDINVTPFFKQLAEHSLLAKFAYTTVPHTSKAIFSIFCGDYPSVTEGIPETLPGGINQPCLPHILKKIGFKNLYFQSATEDFEYRESLISNVGFDEFYPLETMDTRDYQSANYFGYEDEVMLPKSREKLLALKKQKKKFFATYLTVSPHFHYDRINRYGWRQFSDDESYNKYLNALHYQDNFLKKLFQQYKDVGLYDDTIFIVVGDHGEAFREHKTWGHGSILHEEVARIPMLIHDPNSKYKGYSIETPVSLLDILPTVLDSQGYELKTPSLPGQSLLKGNRFLRDIFLECVTPKYCSAMIDSKTGLKYIHNYGRRIDELYDLKNDPEETENLFLFPAYSISVEKMRAEIERWISHFSLPESGEKYQSWGFDRNKLTYLNALPAFFAGAHFSNSLSEANFNKVKLKIPEGTTELLGTTLSKPELIAGDSVRVSFYFRSPSKPICIITSIQGVSRHGIRSYFVTPNDSNYFAITENLQLQEGVFEIGERFEIFNLARDKCLDEIKLGSVSNSEFSVAFRNGNSGQYSLNSVFDVTIPVRQPADHLDFVKSSSNDVVFYPVPHDLQDVNANRIAESYLDQVFKKASGGALPITVHANSYMVSEAFLTKVGNFLDSIKDEYGRYESVKIASVWQNEPVANELVKLAPAKRTYRLKAFFSKGSMIDARVILSSENQVIGLFYYYPWKIDFDPK